MDLFEILSYVVIGVGGVSVMALLIGLLQDSNKEIKKLDKIKRDKENAKSKEQTLAHF